MISVCAFRGYLAKNTLRFFLFFGHVVISPYFCVGAAEQAEDLFLRQGDDFNFYIGEFGGVQAGFCRPRTSRILSYGQSKGLSPFNGLHAPGTNITRNSLAVCIYIAYFLHVGLKSSSRSPLGVAYVVAGSLALTAYAANS